MAHSLLLLCVAWRTIEDKLELQRMAIRSVNIALNLDEVHGNRELPANFQAWLAVPDTNLPNKGTGHRPAWTDGKSEKTDGSCVNLQLRLHNRYIEVRWCVSQFHDEA